MEEAKQQWELAAEGADGCSVRAKLGQGVEAEVRLLSGWPAGSDVVQVVGVSGAAETAKADKVAGLRYEGRSLAQALEAVQRELA